MALCIAFKENDRVYLCHDSYVSYDKEDAENEEFLCSWIPKGSEGLILATPSDCNKKTFLSRFDSKFAELSKDNINKAVLMKEVVPEIIKEAIDCDLCKDNKVIENLNVNQIILYKNRSYFLGASGTIRECGNVDITGSSAQQFFKGAFYVTQHIENVDERILATVHGFLKNYGFVIFPLIIRDTVNTEPRYYYYEDIKRICNKYDIGGNK